MKENSSIGLMGKALKNEFDGAHPAKSRAPAKSVRRIPAEYCLSSGCKNTSMGRDLALRFTKGGQ